MTDMVIPLSESTVTVNPQLATITLEPFVATQATGVEPTGNLLPDAGLQVTVTFAQFWAVGVA